MHKIDETKIMHTTMDDKEVVYHMDTNVYLTLNETMKIIFEGIKAGKGEDGILDELMDIYEVDRSKCRESMNRAIKKLTEHDIIHLVT